MSESMLMELMQRIAKLEASQKETKKTILCRFLADQIYRDLSEIMSNTKCGLEDFAWKSEKFEEIPGIFKKYTKDRLDELEMIQAKINQLGAILQKKEEDL